jgi:hypothetical protein
MDEFLFKKHIVNINRQKNKKEEIILLIKENIGIVLVENSFTISKKEISFNLSSVIRQKLFQNDIESLLKKKGYILKK